MSRYSKLSPIAAIDELFFSHCFGLEPKFRERCKLFYVAQTEKCRRFPSISVKNDQSAVFWRKDYDPAYRHPKS